MHHTLQRLAIRHLSRLCLVLGLVLGLASALLAPSHLGAAEFTLDEDKPLFGGETQIEAQTEVSENT